MRLVNLWFALLGLRTNKLRSALTILGVVIGVGAVIMIVSLGNGLRRFSEQQMEAWSSGTIEIYPFAWRGMPVPVEVIEVEGETIVKAGIRPVPEPAEYSVPTMSTEDVEALRRLATTVVEVVPQLETYGQVVYRGQSMPVGGITGVTPEYLTVYHRSLKYGRFFTQYEEDTAAPVMVLDESMVDYAFGSGVNPVGEVLHLTMQDVPQNFTVIGVLAKSKGISGFGPRSVLLPLRTVQLRLNQEEPRYRVSMIAARVDSRDPADRRFSVAEINTILRARRGIAPGAPEDFRVQDTLQWREEELRIINTITLVLSLIAGISLVVGSIGLMNIMLVGVSEQTWEIGVRRALGARKVDVLAQYLSEGVLLALVGGLGGLGLGLGGSYAGSLMIEQLSGLTTVTGGILAIAVGVSLVVGVAASIYPAWRAASLQPTAALRRG